MPFSPAIIAPTYNNLAFLPEVVERIRAVGLHLYIVDDGSDDGTGRWLDDIASAEAAEAASSPSARRGAVTVLRHARNRGKAAALQTGFAAAAAAGCTHAVTIDTDGQLDPQDIPALLDQARAHPSSLILGNRDDQAPDYPARSRAGRRLSNLAIRLETGAQVADSQCGLRVYPLHLLDIVRCRTGRYAFEAEVITRAAWAGAGIISVPVSCRYFESDRRVSHFRPWIDSCHGVLLHLRLIARSLVPIPVRRLPASEREPSPHPHRSLWRRFLFWLSPSQLWRQIRDDQVSRSSQAIGVGIGVFIANLPIYGFQTLASLYVARRLHIHPLPVVAGAQISTPPINIVLIALAINVGHLVLRGSWPNLDRYDIAEANLGELIRDVLLEWLVGGVIIGALLGTLFALLFLRIFGAVAATGKTRRPESSDSGAD